MNPWTRRPLFWFALVLTAPLAVACHAATAKTTKAAPAKVAPAGVTLAVSDPGVEVGEDLSWRINLVITNTSEVGLYVDSLLCRMEDKDPGETRASRTSLARVPVAIGEPITVSGSDHTEFIYSPPAPFESGELAFTLYGHRGDGSQVTAQTTVTAAPGDVSRRHPSQFETVGGKKVERIWLPANHEGPAPGILLVHGDDSHARRLMNLGLALAGRGWNVMLVSQPGWGQSEGPPDFMGPRTVAALGAMLDLLKRSPGVDSTKLAAWGTSRGAGALALLAETRNDLAALVLQAGIYDLQDVARAKSGSKWVPAIVAEAGSDSSAWRERSAITKAGSIHAPTLILHGDADLVAPASQARDLAARIQAGGAPAEARILAGGDHALQSAEGRRAALTFLTTRFGR